MIEQTRLDYLLAIHTYNTGLGRQYFDYRERLTATIFVAYSALIVAVISLNFSVPSAAIAGTLVIVSRYAELFQLKLYERSAFHFSRSHEILEQIDSEFGEKYRSVTDILALAKKRHEDGFDIQRSERIRTHTLASSTHSQWANFHSLFLGLGIALLLITLLKWCLLNSGDMNPFFQNLTFGTGSEN